MDWEEAIELCEEILNLTDDIPEAGEEFAESVSEKVSSIKGWIEEHERCTDAQANALENMREGVGKWIR